MRTTRAVRVAHAMRSLSLEIANWTELIRLKAHRLPAGTIASLRTSSGLSMLVEVGTEDWRTVYDIWGLQVYGQDPSHIPRAGDVIVDVGANRGYYALWCAHQSRRAYKHLTLVEPSPISNAWLAANIGLNRLERTHTFHAAMTESEDFVEFFVNEDSVANSIDRSDDSPGIVVAAMRLDTVLRSVIEQFGCVDLLKIDIEGAEEAVLASVSSELFRHVARVAIEIDATDRVETVLSPLISAGFTARKGPVKVWYLSNPLESR